MNFACDEIGMRWSNQGRWHGWGMWHAQHRREFIQGFVEKSWRKLF